MPMEGALFQLDSLFLPASGLDWQGGGVRPASAEVSWLETYFPSEVRPRWAGDSFQGAERSYHDFLLGEGDWRVSFEDWADDYGLELRVAGLNAALVARDGGWNQTTGQYETTETPLASFSLTAPSGDRKQAVGVALDIGATSSTNHTVTVSVYSNGSRRLDSHAVAISGFNYAPQGVRFGGTGTGARLYRYHGYLEPDLSAGLRAAAVLDAGRGAKAPSGRDRNQPKTRDPRGMLANTDAPEEGETLNSNQELAERAEEANQDEAAYSPGEVFASEFRAALRAQDFSGTGGYADLVNRYMPGYALLNHLGDGESGLTAGSRICRDALLVSLDFMVGYYTRLRELNEQMTATTAVLHRLQDLPSDSLDSLERAQSGRVERTVEVNPETGYLDWALYFVIPAGVWNRTEETWHLLVQGPCAAWGNFVGAYKGGALSRTYFGDVEIGTYNNCPVGWIDWVATDACGNSYLIQAGGCHGNGDFVTAFSTAHLSTQMEVYLRTQAYFRTAAHMYAQSKARYRQNAELAAAWDALEQIQQQQTETAVLLHARAEAFASGLEKCLGIFDLEAKFAAADGVLSTTLDILSLVDLGVTLAPYVLKLAAKVAGRGAAKAAATGGRTAATGGMAAGRQSLQGGAAAGRLAHGAADLHHLAKLKTFRHGSVGAGKQIGTWTRVNEAMSVRAAEYQARITGRTGEAYLVDGVKFDGFTDGILLEAKGPGYAKFVKNGVFRDFFRGKKALLKQAESQLMVSQKVPIRWHFAEERAAEATRRLFESEGVIGIEIVVTP